MNTSTPLARINELHTFVGEMINQLLDDQDSAKRAQLPSLEAQFAALGSELRKWNGVAIAEQTKEFRALKRALEDAAEAAKRELREVQKLTSFVNTVASVVEKLGAVASAAGV